MSTDTEHHLNREVQERALARASADPRIAAIHTAMAEAYSARVDADGGHAERTPSATAVVIDFKA